MNTSPNLLLILMKPFMTNYLWKKITLFCGDQKRRNIFAIF